MKKAFFLLFGSVLAISLNAQNTKTTSTPKSTVVAAPVLPKPVAGTPKPVPDKPKVYALDTIKTPVPNMANAEMVVMHGFSGEITNNGMMLNGLKEGIWKKYHPSNCLARVEQYTKGILNGLVITIGRNGNLESEENYTDGKFNGVQTYYTFSGNIKKEETYVNGTLDGKRKLFYDNEKPQEETEFKMGVKTGVAKWFNQEGNCVIEYTYVNGSLNGPTTEFFASGKVQREGQYKNDNETGEWKEYDEEGNHIKTIIYKDGVITKETLVKKK